MKMVQQILSLCAITALLLCHSIVAHAAGSLSALTQVFDDHNAAVTSGDYDGALRFRTQKVRGEAQEAFRNTDERTSIQMMMKMMVPASYEISQSDIQASQATLYAVGVFKQPRGGKTVKQEFYMEFEKEGGAWKFGPLVFTGGDPDKVKKSKDVSFDSNDQFDFSKNASVGGRIIDVAFEPDHTRVTIRAMDEEIMVYMPPKAVLKKWKLDAAKLKPGVLIEASGYSHKKNSLKVLAESARFLKSGS